MKARVLLVLLLVPCLACPPPSLKPVESQILSVWLGCHDCQSGELNRVVRLAKVKPQLVQAALGDALLHGPDTAFVHDLVNQVRAGWLRDSAFGRGHGLPLSGLVGDSIVAYEVEDTRRLYQIRAAIALGNINTAQTDALLDSALSVVSDSAVRRYARFARDSLP